MLKKIIVTIIAVFCLGSSASCGVDKAVNAVDQFVPMYRFEYTDDKQDSYKLISNMIRSFANTYKDINIPSEHNGLPVTVIGYSAFIECHKLERVSISDSIETIEGSAFSGCDRLQEVIIPNSVTMIGSNAFENCIRLKNIVIPNSVRTIKGDIFGGCDSLSSLSLPFMDRKIGEFFDFESIFTSIVESSINKISVPNSLRNVAITGGDKIVDNAFNGCEQIENITLSADIKQIGANAFLDCASLKTITYEGTMADWHKIKKGDHWRGGVNDLIVVCTDGSITNPMA